MQARCSRRIHGGYDQDVHDDITHVRVDYDADPLDVAALGSDPMRAFGAWFDDAAGRAEVAEVNAMSLATCADDGTPSVRMVLLKRIDERRAAFACFTNLDSRKAREARATGRAALCWWWPGHAGGGASAGTSPGRQVRVVGRVELVDRDEATAYFNARPADARVGAIVSNQSRAIGDRQELDAAAQRLRAVDTQIPDDWGGIWIVADEIELWQGRHGRLHDRITFLRLGDDGRACSRAAADAAGGDDQLARSGTEVVDPHGTRWLRTRLAP